MLIKFEPALNFSAKVCNKKVKLVRIFTFTGYATALSNDLLRTYIHTYVHKTGKMPFMNSYIIQPYLNLLWHDFMIIMFCY